LIESCTGSLYHSNTEFTHSICPVCEEKLVKEMGDAEKN